MANIGFSYLTYRCYSIIFTLLQKTLEGAPPEGVVHQPELMLRVADRRSSFSVMRNFMTHCSRAFPALKTAFNNPCGAALAHSDQRLTSNRSGSPNPGEQSHLPFHPCIHEQAHHRIPRLHLPVAPKCNIRCGYCERVIVPNSNRVVAPGVSATLLSPEQARVKTGEFLRKWGSNCVVGIAGPGEPLANEQTIETLALIRQEYPDTVLCLCSNGLNLPDRCQDLKMLGVQHLSVTVNGFDPSLVAQIQPTVSKNGRVYLGTSAAEILIENQTAGLREAIAAGMIVKVNCVVVPEINGAHVVAIAQEVKKLGAHVFNPVPLIPRGLFKDRNRPDNNYMTELRSLCSSIIPVFSLCKQCRADAEGIPGEEEAR
jgi:nitrogen fixation protein NifB